MKAITTSRRLMPQGSHRQQGGMALLFALLTLVAMMLATLALVRSVDTSTMLLGNIGFKQDATAATDKAARKAIEWLSDNKAGLNSNSVAVPGYYASTQEFADDGTTAKPPVDATGKQLANAANPANRQLIDWDNNDCEAVATGMRNGCTIKPRSLDAINGNEARYVIFRLCNKAGDYSSDTTIQCATPLNGATGTASGRGDLSYAESDRFDSPTGPYYRIVVRVLGARNTVAFTETLVHF